MDTRQDTRKHTRARGLMTGARALALGIRSLRKCAPITTTYVEGRSHGAPRKALKCAERQYLLTPKVGPQTGTHHCNTTIGSHESKREMGCHALAGTNSTLRPRTPAVNPGACAGTYIPGLVAELPATTQASYLG